MGVLAVRSPGSRLRKPGSLGAAEGAGPNVALPAGQLVRHGLWGAGSRFDCGDTGSRRALGLVSLIFDRGVAGDRSRAPGGLSAYRMVSPLSVHKVADSGTPESRAGLHFVYLSAGGADVQLAIAIQLSWASSRLPEPADCVDRSD